MIKIEENKSTVIYFTYSLGYIKIKKDYNYNKLFNYTVTKVNETDTDITYRMPDETFCTVSKSLQLSIKEVIVRYYILKTFWNNNIYICNSKY